MMAVVWLRDNPANQRLAQSYARSEVATFEDYFEDGWECPECGFDAECTCDVAVYVWFGDERDAAVAADNAETESEAEPGTGAGAEAEPEAGAEVDGGTGAEEGEPGVASH
jgi:hypothetical protein